MPDNLNLLPFIVYVQIIFFFDNTLREASPSK